MDFALYITTSLYYITSTSRNTFNKIAQATMWHIYYTLNEHVQKWTRLHLLLFELHYLSIMCSFANPTGSMPPSSWNCMQNHVHEQRTTTTATKCHRFKWKCFWKKNFVLVAIINANRYRHNKILCDVSFVPRWRTLEPRSVDSYHKAHHYRI